MRNRESRCRLRKADGTAYIRTEAGERGAWQESHYHRCARETYILQQGWLICAKQRPPYPELRVHRAGDIFSFEPGVVHNIYLPQGAVIHTVKHGVVHEADRTTGDMTREFGRALESMGSESALLKAALQGQVQSAGRELPTARSIDISPL